MARTRYPRSDEPLPPPLPPERRTVGQLVAEALRLYGRRFALALPLGLPFAVTDVLAADRSLAARSLVLLAFSPAFTLAYTWAAALATGARLSLRRVTRALVVGTLVFAPAAAVFPVFALAALAWLALVGLVVPVLVAEDVPLRASLGRAAELGRADYVHAIGGLATLVIVFGLTRLALAALLESQADNTVRAAIFLADVVLSPILFLGSSLLYVDQEARLRLGRPARGRRRASSLD